MTASSQILTVSAFITCSRSLIHRKAVFQKLNLVLFSGEGMVDTLLDGHA
jgi:hypothetical protein